MRNALKKLAGILPLAAVFLALGACEDGGPTQPGLRPAAEEGVVYNSSGTRFVVVKENDTNVGVVTGVIGSSGGRLILGKHELNVPRGAVSGPTTFTMTKIDGDHIRVRLTATQLTLNDVGSKGFAVPVTLSLSWENAASLPEDVASLLIAWIRPDGVAVTQSTTVEVQGHRARADLSHFSEYALVHP